MPHIVFNLHFVTRPGEWLLFQRRTGASANQQESIAMADPGGGRWRLRLEFAARPSAIEYRYAVRDADGVRWREADWRTLAPSSDACWVNDEWQPPDHPDAAFSRQAFAGVIFQPERAAPAPARIAGRKWRLALRAPRVGRGFRICVVGRAPELGNWNPASALVMSGEDFPRWIAELPLPTAEVEFKFGLWSDAEQRLVEYEAGANRVFTPPSDSAAEVVWNCAFFRFDSVWKGAGVAIPVFSLRSERGYGIGEFADLAPFAEWAASCGLHLVQVLPVNDTLADFSWRDSYPYKAISAMALHPVYINIESLFTEQRLPLPPEYATRRAALNKLPQVDFEAVLKDKLAYLRQLYAAAGARVLRSVAFRQFFKANAHWLRPYAAFCRLRDLNGTADFTQWSEHAAYAEKKLAGWFKPAAAAHGEVMFHCFVQFHLDAQFQKARAAARAVGVALKGDLPIGIDRCSVEAWTEPELFHMDRQTGAPPDSFSTLGQNWGFPTYDWPRLAGDGFAWWQRRLQRMAACFDALRIDHILGFFRIWEIPLGETAGILGHFNPALPLSRAEIAQAGFTRDPADFAEPVATAESAARLFGAQATRVCAELLRRDADGCFRWREEFRAEQNRAAWIAANIPAAEADALRAGLTRFGYEVLFVADPDQPERWHPRVTVQQTELSASLPAGEREVLARLHDDFFYRRHDRFWEDSALEKLPALMDASRMLICGEDLGMIPAAVPGVLKRLGILSLEVQRMPKRFGQTFAAPHAYPYTSVCTTSTHDMPTLRGWWEEEPAGRARFWRDVMQRDGDAPAQATTDVCEFIVNQNLRAASMWCILPLQDWLGIDAELRHPDAAAERINVPAIPRYYWRYRMHLTIEALQAAAAFTQRIAGMLRETGRQPARSGTA